MSRDDPYRFVLPPGFDKSIDARVVDIFSTQCYTSVAGKEALFEVIKGSPEERVLTGSNVMPLSSAIWGSMRITHQADFFTFLKLYGEVDNLELRGVVIEIYEKAHDFIPKHLQNFKVVGSGVDKKLILKKRA